MPILHLFISIFLLHLWNSFNVCKHFLWALRKKKTKHATADTDNATATTTITITTSTITLLHLALARLPNPQLSPLQLQLIENVKEPMYFAINPAVYHPRMAVVCPVHVCPRRNVAMAIWTAAMVVMKRTAWAPPVAWISFVVPMA